jgi:protein TonB
MSANWLANVPHERPHADRVAAMSGALAINVLVFGALLLPLTQAIDLPERVRSADKPLDVTIIPRAVVLPVPEVPPPPVIRPRPVSTPTTLVDITEQKPVIVDATVPVPVTTPVQVNAAVPVDTGPIQLPVGDLAYEYAPAPQYPPLAMRRRWQGVVLLRVLVGQDGSPLQVKVERSSGRPILDTAARNQVASEWRFRPAMREGAPVQAWGLVPISFSLYER